ncbi:MAG: hypothetical protein ACLFOY_00740 [Desulfatibacillaceae bacterium]
MKIRVTEQNIERAKQELPDEWADELEVGCETWPFQQASARGRIAVWPSGRAAIETEGLARWGQWSPRRQVITSYDGKVYDAEGKEVAQPENVTNFVVRGIPKDTWRRFLDMCGEEGRGASEKLREMIANEVGKTL